MSNKSIITIFEKWKEIDKMVYIEFNFDAWSRLMKVVEFIEDIQNNDKYYTWEEANDKGILETHSNFRGYTVEIIGHCCFIDIQLALNPPKSICRKIGSSKFEAVLDACYQFACYYNNNEL